MTIRCGSIIYLGESLVNSLIGAEIPVFGIEGLSILLIDSEDNLILVDSSGKIWNTCSREPRLELIVNRALIKDFFDTYIGENTFLKFSKREGIDQHLVHYLVNFQSINDVGKKDDINLWVRGDYLRKDEKDDPEWKFTSDAAREKVVISFTLFPNTWYIDLPGDDENYMEISKRISEELGRKGY